MLSLEAINVILGITEKVPISAKEMADKMNITFFPCDRSKISRNVLDFSVKLEKTLAELRVNIVPYNKALITVPLHKSLIKSFLVLLKNLLIGLQKVINPRKSVSYIDVAIIPNLIFKRRRIKPGISVIAIGESDTKNLPMDNTLSFRESTVITVLDMPPNINNSSGFHEHFDTAMGLFAYHMSNIVIGVSKSNWVVYNFNASHPMYDLNDNEFKKHILNALIPKVVAPIRPHRFSDFILKKDHFDIHDKLHASIVTEFLEGGNLLGKTNLYPPGKKIDDLPFRNNFYRWIGKLHLDHRNGMSYGFLAWQMPTELSEVITKVEAEKKFGKLIPKDKDYFISGNDIYIIIKLDIQELCMKVPTIWVLSQRSGSDKTHMRPDKDLVKMGLVNGKMFLQTPKGLELDEDYRPSFDTKVILAHALGNSILASLLKYKLGEVDFVKLTKEKGMALAHWHGYINPSFIPKGWHVHGIDNPHVACSSPQSAIYSLMGKFNVFLKALSQNEDYFGDVHIEPHHGTNISFTSIKSLATFFNKNPKASTLGNEYLYLYKSEMV